MKDDNPENTLRFKGETPLIRPKPEGIGVDSLRDAGLPSLLAEIDKGFFGTTLTNLRLLEALAAALDTAVEAYDRLAEKLCTPKEVGVTLNPLTDEEKCLTGYFLIRVFGQLSSNAATALADVPDVEGSLSEEGLDALAGDEPPMIARRLARLLTEFVRREKQHPTAEPLRSSEAAVRAVLVFLTLLGRAEETRLARGRLSEMKKRLHQVRIEVGDTHWEGFTPLASKADDGTLLRKVTPEDIVGNRAFLEAGLRLARDVAGYDFERRMNPKHLNPILFALGRPGCGKTLVAHAVANSFLEYCRSRGIKAKFTVIRKSDWASSYQNASAANLIRIFKELYAFDGLTGIYWADIDTALASRDQSGLRSEEKADLSAAFNIFDGTLIPFDGKWFMICDANNLAMDEALRTRIAKNPFRVRGPECKEDYVRLLRDILLRDFAPFLKIGGDAWTSLGEMCLNGDISGRGIEGISRQIIDRIEDFEYPDDYYRADFDGRKAMIELLSNEVDANAVKDIIERYIAFEKDEEARLAQKKFDDAVKEAVFELNVRKEVLDKVVTD